MLEPTVSAIPHVKAGRLKALGITSLKRSSQLPDVATIAEQGLSGFEVTSWAAMMVPAATPEPIVQSLNAALRRAAQSKEVSESMRSIGLESAVDTSARFASYLQSESKKWGKAVADAGVQLDN
jgi:tripartite-type tricarboxylate transporter receptor subunit TctC